MSIAQVTKYSQQLVSTIQEFEKKYKNNHLAKLELKKLSDEIKYLNLYLINLDKLVPHYNTDKLNNFIKGILLHMDILQVELEKDDYKKLFAKVGLIKTMLKFHPTKYSLLAFISAWFLELTYFI